MSTYITKGCINLRAANQNSDEFPVAPYVFSDDQDFMGAVVPSHDVTVNPLSNNNDGHANGLFTKDLLSSLRDIYTAKTDPEFYHNAYALPLVSDAFESAGLDPACYEDSYNLVIDSMTGHAEKNIRTVSKAVATAIKTLHEQCGGFYEHGDKIPDHVFVAATLVKLDEYGADILYRRQKFIRNQPPTLRRAISNVQKLAAFRRNVHALRELLKPEGASKALQFLAHWDAVDTCQSILDMRAKGLNGSFMAKQRVVVRHYQRPMKKAKGALADSFRELNQRLLQPVVDLESPAIDKTKVLAITTWAPLIRKAP